jgi:hypothetical protein
MVYMLYAQSSMSQQTSLTQFSAEYVHTFTMLYSVVSISYDGYRHILSSLKMDMSGIEVALYMLYAQSSMSQQTSLTQFSAEYVHGKCKAKQPQFLQSLGMMIDDRHSQCCTR